jgi:hypothetical protein
VTVDYSHRSLIHFCHWFPDQNMGNSALYYVSHTGKLTIKKPPLCNHVTPKKPPLCHSKHKKPSYMWKWHIKWHKKLPFLWHDVKNDIKKVSINWNSRCVRALCDLWHGLTSVQARCEVHLNFAIWRFLEPNLGCDTPATGVQSGLWPVTNFQKCAVQGAMWPVTVHRYSWLQYIWCIFVVL